MQQQHEYEAYHQSDTFWRTPRFHSHSFYELFFYITGAATMVIESERFKLQSGDVIIIPPNQMHRASHDNPNCYYERMYLYITPAYLKSIGTETFSCSDVIEDRVHTGQLRLHLEKSILNDFIAQGEALIATSIQTDAAGRQINRLQMQLMLTQLSRMLQNSHEEQSVSTRSRMGDVIAYINAHLTEDMNLDELAERFYISKYHMLHEFREYANTSIYQYILTKRVIYAKNLLLAGCLPNEAAGKSGFSDYSCFYKAFRKCTGISPRQYSQVTDTKHEFRSIVISSEK